MRIPVGTFGKASVAVLCALSACTPISPERAAERCEERARAAQGPTGEVTVGVNSNTGGFSRAEVAISSDFLRGRDPVAVYERCVIELTGQPPTRPFRLR